MRFVEFQGLGGGPVYINPEFVLGIDAPLDGDHTSVVMVDRVEIRVMESPEEVCQMLTNTPEHPVDEPAKPVVLSLVCKNCGGEQDSHLPNWLGGLNCNVYGDTQTYFDPEIRKD